MGYTVIRLDDEPIVVVRVYGKMTLSEQARMILEIANLIENVPGKIYRVVDATGRQATFVEMVALTSRELKGWAGTASDPRVITLAAIDNANTLLAARTLVRAFAGQRRFFVFRTMTDALTSARELIAVEVRNSTRVTP